MRYNKMQPIIPKPYISFPSISNNMSFKRQDHKTDIIENKVDNYFNTKTNSTQKFSHKSMIGSVLGTILSVLALGKINNPKIKLNSAKNLLKLTKFEYGTKELTTISTSAILGGLAGGLLDK